MQTLGNVTRYEVVTDVMLKSIHFQDHGLNERTDHPGFMTLVHIWFLWKLRNLKLKRMIYMSLNQGYVFHACAKRERFTASAIRRQLGCFNFSCFFFLEL